MGIIRVEASALCGSLRGGLPVRRGEDCDILLSELCCFLLGPGMARTSPPPLPIAWPPLLSPESMFLGGWFDPPWTHLAENSRSPLVKLFKGQDVDK